ncbi:uncharacterized protein LOC141909720 isoform X2 [Tubulanus polymorphus]|uniref:uncharacterized protein LOC141909720 isoform X2 n=1 Tax=Tubulanus polymorphus TaxID=672921 RepID=UPI003DA1DA5C
MFPMKLILIGACLVCLTSATLESERLQNTITTQFYQMTPAQWTPLTSRFKDILLIDLNGYCRNNPAACGINNNLTLYKNFSASDIVFSPAPRQNKHYLVISLYVTLPAGGSLSTPQLTQFVLYKNALMDIMNTSRPDINRDLGFDVVQIGLDEYYKSPDRQMNVVMIPISFVVLLIIICITVGLECYSKRKEKEEKRQQRIQKQHDRKLETQAKNNKTKVGPSPEETPNHILENETDKPARWNSSSRESFNKMALTADDKPDETGATNQPNGIDGVEVDAVDGVGIVVVGTADGAERTDSPPPPDYSTDNGGLDMNGIVETEADNYLNSESGAGKSAATTEL